MNKLVLIVLMGLLAACGQPRVVTQEESYAFVVGEQCRQGANNMFDPWVNELEWQEYYDECMRSAGL